MGVIKCLTAALLLLVSVSFVSAQTGIPNLSSNAEVIFFNASNSASQPIVTVALKGVVFRDDGRYQTSVESYQSHPEYNYYATNSLTGGTTGGISAGEERYWESVCRGDGRSDPQYTLGMLGLGEYSVQIKASASDANPLVFTLNTIDGEWCATTFPGHSMFYFYIYIDGSGQKSVSYYKWNGTPPNGSWVTISQGSQITSWDLRSGTRERSYVLSTSASTRFYVNATDGPFPLNVGDATLDVNTVVDGMMVIRGGKTFRIHAASIASGEIDTQNPGLTRTTIQFNPDAGIVLFDNNSLEIQGYCLGYEQISSDLSPNNIDDVGVHLTTSILEPSAGSWAGIMLVHDSDKNVSLDIHGASISYAEYGIAGFMSPASFPIPSTPIRTNQSWLYVDSSLINACNYGIWLCRTNFTIEHSIIQYCAWNGIFMTNTFGRCVGKARDIYKCTIRFNKAAGIVCANTHGFVPDGSDGLTMTNSVIMNNRGDGMFVLDGVVSVHSNIFERNGYNSDGSTYLNGSDGLWLIRSTISVHDNVFSGNSKYGFACDAATYAYGQILLRSNGTHPSGVSVHGKNCFMYNNTNLSARTTYLSSPRHPGTTRVHLGAEVFYNPLPDPDNPGHSSAIVGGYNKFIEPLQQYQVVSMNKSVAFVSYNYWTSADATDFNNPNGVIYHQPVYIVDPDVSCDWGLPIASTSGTTPTLSLIGEHIFENLVRQNYDSAFIYAANNINCEVPPEEISVYAEALFESYVFAQNQDAYDLLESLALQPQNPCDTTCQVQWVFTQFLLKADMMSWNSGKYNHAMMVADTLLQRNCDNNAEDNITAITTQVQVLWSIYRDTATATTMITDLWNNYPDDQYVCWLYNFITGDTTAFDYLPKAGAAPQTRIACNPSKLTLNQNYPNPFNPTTEITYGIPEDGTVKLAVYNNLGQEVKVLVNQPVKAGTYTVQFDATGLPSGMYLYKLETGNGSQSKKMVLMK